MRSLTVQSYAKLNLGLWIVNRRADGHHNLVTLFHRISLADTLRLKKSSTFSLRCSDPRLPTGEKNLITQAYRLLQKKFKKLGGVSVHLLKKIPAGGGLGGGSSNAAAFLLAMKKLYGLRVGKQQLMRWGAELGADVPFFLLQVNQAVGTGKGERLVPKPGKRRLFFTLLISHQPLSTKKVYQNLPRRLPGASLTKLKRAVTILSEFLNRNDFSQAQRLLWNDLEKPAFRLRPSIQRTIAKFKTRGARVVRMSGSGPTVFAIFGNESEAKRLARELRRDQSEGVAICHSV